MSLERLFRPSSVAVFGGREATEVIRQCQQMGFAGDIWPVHPQKDRLAGYLCYRNVASLPGVPDASFIGVNRHLTVEIVAALKRVGAGGAVCYASGFSEVKDGAALTEALLEAAGDMPVLGPNCYGLINYLDGALLWPDQQGGERVEQGVALFTQSSNIGLNLTMQARGLPLAYLVALGNQAQINLAHALEVVLLDQRVTAVGLYIEGFVDVCALQQVMSRARERELPVVALKAGRTEHGARLAMTHTASMIGVDEVAGALLKRLGIARVNDLNTLIEALKLLHVHGPLGGNRLCSMSCSGGEASLMADAAATRDLVFPELNAAQHDAVAETLNDLVVVSNPLDYHTFNWNCEELLYTSFRAMLGCGFDLSMLVLDLPRADRCTLETWQPAINAICRAARDTGAATAVVATLPENLPEVTARSFMAKRIAPLCGVEQALDAVAAAATIGRAWQYPLLPLLPGPTPFQESGLVLNEWASKQYLVAAGVAIPRGTVVNDLRQLRGVAQALSFPLVLKVCDSNMTHKSEHSAVVLNIRSEEELLDHATTLIHHNPQLLVEEMVADAVCELIVGVAHDPCIGPWMMIGSGGVLAELVGDSTVVLVPTNRAELEAALRSLKVYPLLTGFRGGPMGDSEALLQVLLAVSDLALAQRQVLAELDINPLIVRPRGRGVVAVDALLRRVPG